MIRSALAAAVVVNLGGRTDKTSVVNQGLDFALGEMTKAYGWKELESTSDVSISGTVLTITDGAWDAGDLTLTKTGAFTSYTFVAGDRVYVSGGTGITVGWATIEEKTSNNVLTLTESIGASDASDVAATLIGNPEYVNLPTNTLHVVRARLIDGTSSQRIAIKTKGWLQDRWPNVASLACGVPKWAYEDKSLGRLYLYPVANENYTIRVTITQVRTSFAEDATACPVTGLDLALIAWATGYVFQAVEQFANAELWFQRARTAAMNAEQADRRSREELRAEDGADEEEGLYLSAEPWLDPFVREIT